MIRRLGFAFAAATLAASGAQASTVFSNDFSKGLSSAEQVTGNFTVGDGYVGHHAGAYPNFDYSTYQLDLDLTGVTDAFLDFDYDVSSEAGYDLLDVTVNGLNLASYSGAEAGHAHFALGDLSGLATILFAFHSDYLVNRRGVELDNVSVTGSLARSAAVPETTTWLTMALGFGLLGGVMRRRPSVRVETNS
jgi:hypothetical protein